MDKLQIKELMIIYFLKMKNSDNLLINNKKKKKNKNNLFQIQKLINLLQTNPTMNYQKV